MASDGGRVKRAATTPKVFDPCAHDRPPKSRKQPTSLAINAATLTAGASATDPQEKQRLQAAVETVLHQEEPYSPTFVAEPGATAVQVQQAAAWHAKVDAALQARIRDTLLTRIPLPPGTRGAYKEALTERLVQSAYAALCRPLPEAQHKGHG